MLIKASAPGRITLLGEHAVLHKHKTIVSAVDQRISILWSARADDRIQIESKLGSFESKISQLKIVPPFQFVLAMLLRFKKYFKHGFSLKIEADFSDQIGLASSASVTVATLAILNSWLDLQYSPLKMVQVGRQVIRQIQGFGSGADVAASLYGGVVAFCMQPLTIEPLNFSYPLTLLYSGSKTTTVDVVNIVNKKFQHQPKLFKNIMNAIGSCSSEGRIAIQKQKWHELGHIMNIQQGFMESLGVSTPLLTGMIEELRSEPGILGAKISGAGLGDCVVALGAVSKTFSSRYIPEGVKRIEINLEKQGITCEKI